MADICDTSGLNTAAANAPAPHLLGPPIQGLDGGVDLRKPSPSVRMSDAVRTLAIDAVEAAGSGHPGMPMGMADVATVLWSRVLKFDAADPRWADRDRFVLSAGHGSMLLYALLHLTGHDGIDIAALQRFRQLDSPASGTPEHGEHPAIEATTGPLGQGLATAVGMALAERMMAARFGKSLVDHRTWVVASDGDMMQGVTHEAASLAGHLQLDKLTVLWEEGPPSSETNVLPATSEDTLKRFVAQGWATKRIDSNDETAIAAALALALRSRKPMLIACRASAGVGVFDGVDRAAVDLRERSQTPFTIPEMVLEQWGRAGTRGTPARRAWLKRLANHPLRAEFERVILGRLPEAWHEATAALKTNFADTRPSLPSGKASELVLDCLGAVIPELIGGAADLSASTLAQSRTMTSVTAGTYGGQYIHYGNREHGMAAIANGIALHGGFVPFAGAVLAFSDYMRPALRLSALMRQRIIHVFTHDSIGLGGDGPAHQPIEQLASLRAMPGMQIMRPADSVETVECWELAIRRTDGPTLLVLSDQSLPALRSDVAENRCGRGGYVLAEADGPRKVTLIASGSEVAIALEARSLLAAEGIPAAVVSLPCWELFAALDESARTLVLGTVLRVGIEAACGFGWERWLGCDGIFIGMTGYGASAPGPDLFRHFGITPEAIVQAARKRLQLSQQQGE